ncbi:MAG: NUDIX domain-containing protein [Clostridia bacterium]|nr:NUDIX domain-containing protein [Clostridia bacterium]
MSEEMLDVYTRDGKYIGIRTRAECHTENPGFYHKPAWSWVYNSKGEILIQKRAMCKKRFAGYWDMACAGHVDAGETPMQGAIREAKEEIGLDVSENDIKFMGELIEDEDYWEIGQIFFIKADKDIDEFILDKNEVEEVKWISFDELKELLYSDIWAPCSEEYKTRVLDLFSKMFNQGKVIALCGKVASGKSTYAKKIREKENAIIFSVDELTYYMVDNKSGQDYTDLCRRATNYFEAKSAEIAGNGGNVIIDIGLWTKNQRKEIREYFKNKGINFEIHYVKVDDDTWMKNIVKRNQRIEEGDQGYDFVVGEGLLEKVKRMWEEPGEEVDFVYEAKYND